MPFNPMGSNPVPSEKKKMLTDVDYANKVLDYLCGHGSYRSTEQVMVALTIPKTSRDTLLKHMNRLYDRGILFRSGSGKYTWKCKITTWSRTDPFARQNDNNDQDEIDNTYTYEVPPATNNDDGASIAHIKALKFRIDELQLELGEQNERLRDHKAELEATKLDFSEKLKSSSRYKEVVEFKQFDNKSVKMKNVLLPAVFDDVHDLVSCRLPVMLVGPAGCGKTHLAKLVSDSLGFKRFGTMSCTEGITESHLFGKGIPNLAKGTNNFEGTEFLECYEEGGLFLLDEIDAANSNFLLSMNMALANGRATVSARKSQRIAVMHEDFACIAAANTFGKGANRQYVGRNQLDEATLDRYRMGIVEMDYDPAVEMHLCPHDELRERLVKIRNKCREAAMLRIVSTRFMRDAYTMVSQRKWSVDKIVTKLMQGWSTEEKAKALAA